MSKAKAERLVLEANGRPVSQMLLLCLERMEQRVLGHGWVSCGIRLGGLSLADRRCTCIQQGGQPKEDRPAWRAHWHLPLSKLRLDCSCKVQPQQGALTSFSTYPLSDQGWKAAGDLLSAADGHLWGEPCSYEGVL